MKKDNKQMDELQARFDKDEIQLPASLSRDAVVEKLKAEEIKQAKKKNRVLPRVAAVAAAVAIIATSIALVPKHHRIQTSPVTSATTTRTAQATDGKKPALEIQLSKFDSDAEMKEYFLNQYQEWEDDYDYDVYDDVEYDDAEYWEDDTVAAAPSPTTPRTTRAPGTPTTARPETQASAAYAATQAASRPNAALPNGAAAPKSAASEEAFTVADTAANSVTRQTNDATGNYGETNTQVQGVDEADIVKNDGRFLYIVRNRDFVIVDTETMKEVYHSEVAPKEKNNYYTFQEMYLSGSRMILTATEWERAQEDDDDDYSYYWDEEKASAVLLFDVSNKTAPQLLRTVAQDGDVVSSRMVDSVIYVATRYYVDTSSKETVAESYAPKVDGKRIGCTDVYLRDPDEDVDTYLVLTAWDTARPDSKVNKLSLLTESEEVYCSNDTFYVLNSVWDWDERTDIETDSTEIFAFAFSGTKLALRATGVVSGVVNDQYAVDQSGDTLRITTTDYDYAKDVDVSSLYVLDRDLKTIGKLKDIAPDEQVKSTRFMGNMAYVVTFRNTDPLFVIDLSDPKHPEIKGEVKLPGFSAYLHPISETLLVGIGYNGDDDSADFDTVKLSLFDVSDPAKPKEVDTHVIKDASTSVDEDPKAVVFDSERGILGFPVIYERWTPNGSYYGDRYVYKTITIKDGKFTDEQAYTHEQSRDANVSLFRGTYIGDRVYTLTDINVKEFDLASAKELRSVTLTEQETETPRPMPWRYMTGFVTEAVVN